MARTETEIVKEKRPFIESSCMFTNKEDNTPFSRFEIMDSDFLEKIPERSVCPCCHKSRRYYCYNCFVPVEDVVGKIPSVKLPVKIDIVKHPKEVEGKSTSAHAAVLASEDVRVFTYPDFPQYDKNKVLLIFPGTSSIPLSNWWTSSAQSKFIETCQNEILHQMQEITKTGENCNFSYHLSSSNHCYDENSKNAISETKENLKKCICHQNHHKLPIERVLFIDSTWKQTKRLYRDPLINSLPCVVLTSHRSLFWRHQRGKPEFHLATIEAVYYFLVELHQLMFPDVPYCGAYDNLLFFFKFMYYKIRTLYDPNTLKAYQDQPSTS